MRAAFAVLLLAPAVAGAQIEGAVDLHVHSAPDSRPRSLTAIETAEVARRYRMRALLFKNHFVETATLAFLVAQVVPEVEAYGGIALNRSVGGINPAAVEQMAMMTGGHGRVVWMPTVDAEHASLGGDRNPNAVPVARGGVLLPDVIDVLELIAERGLTLATGHSSAEESVLLVRAARERGIERIVVTHPLGDLAMPLELRREVVRLGALLEYPVGFVAPIGDVPFDELARLIRETGPESVVLSTDLGQAANPIVPAGLAAAVDRLAALGFTATEIDAMIRRNPARLLGLD